MTICDSHVHVVADPELRPQVSDRTHAAGEASLVRLVRAARPHGVGRFVVVQPSFYGTDNGVTLEAVAALGREGRGVAVIDPARVTQAEIRVLTSGGIVGLRINFYSTLAEQRGGSMRESFAAIEAVARHQAWHVEVVATTAKLAAGADLFAQSSVPVVVDHYGIHGGVEPSSEPGRALLSLLRLPHVWMKLSAPYRCSDNPLAVRPHPDWLAAILDTNADRCVWGSDWPHTAQHEQQTCGDVLLPYRALDYGAVFEGARSALPMHSVDAILRHNPARLYGFSTE